METAEPGKKKPEGPDPQHLLEWQLNYDNYKTLSNATGGLLGIVFFTKHSQKTGFAFAQYKARKNFLSLRNF